LWRYRSSTGNNPIKERLALPSSELVVIVKAKSTISYIFEMTQKSPKNYRWSVVARMHALCVEILEELYAANELPAHSDQRITLQVGAIGKLKTLAFLNDFAVSQGVILAKQYENAAKMLAEVQKLAVSWARAERARRDGR
jgi:hypothetical protein